jgi:hypothetical protein
VIEELVGLAVGGVTAFCFIALLFYLPPKDSEEAISYIFVYILAVLGMSVLVQELLK